MKDEVSLRRLVLVKRLYLEGLNKAQSRHNYADQMLAVINLFLAVESVMRAVVLDVEEQPERVVGKKGYANKPPLLEQVRYFKIEDFQNFEQLYNQVVAICRDKGTLGENEQLFKWSALKRLQEARNGAQHGAIAPHPDRLPEFAGTAKDFVERVLQLNFQDYGESLAEISLAGLIEDMVLREFSKSAERALTQRRIRTCSLLVRIAFLLGRLKRDFDWWRDRGGGSIIDDYDASSHMSQHWDGTGLSRETTSNHEAGLLYDVMIQAGRLPYLYDNWVLGLDRLDRHRLYELTPRLVHYDEGVTLINSPSSDEVSVLHFLDKRVLGEEDWSGPYLHKIPSEDDCLWALDYVTETLLRWQGEERGRLAAVDPKYRDAISKLESLFDETLSGNGQEG